MQIQNNFFNQNIQNDFIKNIYSDETTSKYEFLNNKTNKISTIVKPYIWRNHIYNLPTTTPFQNSNCKYSVGIEIIHNTSMPILLFKILSRKDITTYYGYKIRSYKDIFSSNIREEYIKTESVLNKDVDYINKVVDYDKDNLDLIFSECYDFGLTNKNKSHQIRTYYFKEKNINDSFFFIFEIEIRSDLTGKNVCRNLGFNITGMNNKFNDIKSVRQSFTIKEVGIPLGHYEVDAIGLSTVEDEDEFCFYDKIDI